MGARSRPGRALPLQEAARIAGHYRWVEKRTFEILGGWVPGVPELDVKLTIAAHGPHHAWHSTLWRERLPELAGVDREALTIPANAEVAAFMDALGEDGGADQTIEKLAGAYRVLLPRLVAGYRGYLDRSAPVTDAPTIRCLRLMLGDDVAEWQEGETLIQSLLIDEAAVRRAADRQARLEAMLVQAGGITGSPPPL
jgi:hypothetical protein